MPEDNIFLNSEPVTDPNMYPREADGVQRTSQENYDLSNWNDTQPEEEQPPECSVCKQKNNEKQENQQVEETTFVEP